MRSLLKICDLAGTETSPYRPLARRALPDRLFRTGRCLDCWMDLSFSQLLRTAP